MRAQSGWIAIVIIMSLLPGPVRADEDAALQWLSTVSEAQAQAQKRKRPILLRVGSESCAWCRKQEADFREARLQAELGRWILVYQDERKYTAPRGEQVLLPTLRLLTPTGQTVATQVGYVAPDRLIAWLGQHYDTAATPPSLELTDPGEPAEATVRRLVGELGRRDPLVREAALRRLLPFPKLAAPPVVQGFTDGSLQTRLAALELLREWGAPVAGLDPWQAETVTADRLKTVKEWSANPGDGPGVQARKLTPANLDTARADLDRMVQAADGEAAAIRERLARFGAALLPEVYTRLPKAASDQARERLTALRYRLVASDALALSWPSGLERLAATAAPTRQQAVQELGARATPADEPLLLELFSNTDPLVRELTLRALHTVSGRKAATALTKLLDDPDPNVRAAVLKQLAEVPSEALVPRIKEYLGKETDLDLVVHAIRALRGIRGAAPVEPLKGQLGHASWRVRAEAVEILGEWGKEHRYESNVDKAKADVYATLIEKLKDEDGFVVGRAILALSKADQASAVEPMVAAARRHPELAPEVIKALAYGDSTRLKAVPYLRQFCKDERAEIRAAAVTYLCQVVPDEVNTELRAGLQDKDSLVRSAAAEAIYDLPGLQQAAAPPPPSGGVLETIGRILSGQMRTGIAALADLLKPLLKAEAAAERLAAARPLTVLGHDAEALPVLREAARAEPGLRSRAADVLSWLPWDKRVELYQFFLTLEPDPELLSEIVREMTTDRNLKAIDLLWELVGQGKVENEAFGAALYALRQMYFGDNWKVPPPDSGLVIPAAYKAGLETIRKKTAGGPDAQRRMALAVLAAVHREQTPDVARTLFQNERLSPELRQDALRALLATLARPLARQEAAAALSHADPVVRRLAVQYLALGSHYGLSQLSNGNLGFTGVADGERTTFPDGQVGPILSEVPKSLTTEMVRPFLQDSDPATVAAAGYLLVLLGEPAGLDPLLRYWRKSGREEGHWVRLVCRAIAATNDDARVRLLEEIYQTFLNPPPHDSSEARYTGLDDFDVREFYWTIRTMDGPNALALRKEIRAEVGMDALR